MIEHEAFEYEPTEHAPITNETADHETAAQNTIDRNTIDHQDSDSTATYAERLRAIQLAFIDDPRQAALDADDLVAEVLRSIADDVARRRSELETPDGTGTGTAAPDTENLRLAVRRSRELVTLLTQADPSPRAVTAY